MNEPCIVSDNAVLIKEDIACPIIKDLEASPHDLSIKKSNSLPTVSLERKLTHHLETNKFFRCSMCPFLCLNQIQIIQHIANKHKNKFPSPQIHLKCPGCKNTFCSRCSLQLHLLNYHQVDPNDISGLLSLAIRVEITYNEKYDVISYLNLEAVPLSITEDPIESTDFNNFTDSFQDQPDFHSADSFSEEFKNPLDIKFSDAPIVSAGVNVLNLSQLNQKQPMVKNEILILPKAEQSLDLVALPSSKEKSNSKSKTKSIKPKTEKPKTVEKSEKIINKPVKMLKCWYNHCNVRLKSEANMQYHQQCHVNGEPSLHCPECKIKVTVWNSLRGHLWREHKIDMELYACDQCTYRTFSMSKLNAIHKLIHGESRSFLCDICAKAFKNPKQLRNHKMIHKNRCVETLFQCEICWRKFTNKRLLKLHKEAVHEKLKKHLCKFCGYKAHSKNAVQLHERTHTGFRPFSCSLCEYTTADRNSLRRHNLRHTGQYSYKCPYCSYTCIQSSTFKNHLKSKHPNSEGKNMFSCKMCSFKSLREENYLSHLVSKHKISPLQIAYSSDKSTNETQNVDTMQNTEETEQKTLKIIEHRLLQNPTESHIEEQPSPSNTSSKILTVKSNEEVKINDFFMLNPNLYKLITLGSNNKDNK